MKLPDLLISLAVLAERVSHDDRFVVFEAMRRLRHEEGYVQRVTFRAPTPEMERFLEPKMARAGADPKSHTTRPGTR